MNEKERELLIDLTGRVAVLEHQNAALNEMVIALVVTFSEKTNTSMTDIATMLEVIRFTAHWRKGKKTADFMQAMTIPILALGQLQSVTSLEYLVSDAMLHRDAGDSRLEALHSWIAQATPDELAEDYRRVLAQLAEQFDLKNHQNDAPDPYGNS